MLYVQDAKKRRLMVKSGGVRFDEKGRAVSGDMLICLDLDKNEMAYVSAKDVTFVGSEPAKDYAEKYRQKLQEVNSAGYEVPEETSSVAGSPVEEGTKGLPEPGADADGSDEAMRRMAKDGFNAEMQRGGVQIPEEQAKGLMEHNRRMAEEDRARREAYREPAPVSGQELAEEPSGNYDKDAIPTDGEGEPMYEGVPKERTVEDLFGRLGDGGLAHEFATAKVAEAEKRVVSLNKKAPKMGTKVNEYLRKKAEYEAAVKKAEESVDYWQGVKDDIERLTHTTAEDLKEQKRELDGTAAKESMIVEDDTPESGVALAAAILADSKVTPESLKAETGFSAKDYKGFVGMLAKAENGGKSIASIAENVAEMDRAYYDGRYFGGDDAAARDAVLEALGMAKTRGELRALARPNEAKAVREYEDERDRLFYNQYGMGYEEYLDYAEQEMVHVIGNLSNFDEEKYLQEHAVEITEQIDKEHGKGIEGHESAGEEPVHGAGGEVLSGEGVDESAGGGPLAGHGEGEAEVRGGHHKDAALEEEASGGGVENRDHSVREQGGLKEAKPTSLSGIPSEWKDSKAQAVQAEIIESPMDISDEAFTGYSQSVILPRPSKSIEKAIDGNGKSVLIKRGVFAKNDITHGASSKKGLTPEQSRMILNEALYAGNLVGKTQPATKPNYWVVVKTDNKNKVVVLEVSQSKDFIEIVGWEYRDDKGLENLYNQAERNHGEIIELEKEDGSEDGPSLIQDQSESSAADLSALTSSSGSKGINKQSELQAEGGKSAENDKIEVKSETRRKRRGGFKGERKTQAEIFAEEQKKPYSGDYKEILTSSKTWQEAYDRLYDKAKEYRAKADEWRNKVYKKHGGSVEVGGKYNDLDARNVSIDYINERRRENAVKSLEHDAEVLEKGAEQLKERCQKGVEPSKDPMQGIKDAADAYRKEKAAGAGAENSGRGGQQGREDVRPKQKVSQKVRSALESIAEDLGYKVVWHETLEDNGYIDYKKKEMHIAEDAENPLDAVFGHESTHAIRKSSEAEFVKLRDAVKRLIGEDKWNELIKSKREEDYAEAKLEEEVTGDVVGSIFHDRKMAEGLARELKGDPGIIAKIREIWHKIIDRLKSIGAKDELKQTEDALAAFEAVVHAFKTAKEKVDEERLTPGTEMRNDKGDVIARVDDAGDIAFSHRTYKDFTDEDGNRHKGTRSGVIAHLEAQEIKNTDNNKKEIAQKAILLVNGKAKVDDLVKEDGSQFDNNSDSDKFMEATGEDGIDRSKRKKVKAYDYDRYPLGRVEPGLADKDVEIVKAGKTHGFANYNEAKGWAKDNIARIYNDEETGGKGNVRISNSAIDKFLSQSAVDKSDNKDVHMAVLKVLPKVLKESIDVETHPDFLKGENGKRSSENGINKDVLVHRLYGAVNIDGKTYRVKITLKEDVRNKDIPHNTHSYEATKIELLEGTLVKPEDDNPNTNNSISATKLLKDVEMSYNPGAKVLAESAIASEDGDIDFSKRKSKNPVANHIIEVNKKVGGKVRTVTGADEVTDERVKAALAAGEKVKGWYDGKTGEVCVYLPNVKDKYTAEKVVWHETVGHKGMRGLLGEKGYRDWQRGLWYDLDNPVNADLRAYVKDRIDKDSLSMYDAIEEYVADAAEKGKGEPGFWNGLRNGVTAALQEAGFRVSPNVKDVQYMLWLAKNVQKHPDNPVWKMRAEAARWKIDHRGMRLSKERGGELVDNDGRVEDWDDVIDEEMDGKIHFSTSPAAATEIDQYNRAVGCKTAMLKESYLDKMNSVMELMKVLIPGMERVEDVNPMMNPLMAENLMASQISARGTKFVNQEMARLTKAYNEAIDAFPGKNTEDRMRAASLYMIEKHGLERNRVFYVRDYIEKMRKKGDEQGAGILQRQWNAEKKDLGDKLRNGQMNLAEYYREMDEWIRCFLP